MDVISDNGPQFSSQSFTEFARRYDFQHTTSSPLYAQGNGQAERTVQTVKRLLRDSTDPYIALLTYRSTPFPWCMRSPAELLMGRQLRANIPVHSTQLIPDWSYVEEFRKLNKTFKQKQKKQYDRQHGVRSRSSIPDSSDVWITSGNEPTKATVVQPAETPRSYIVETPSGEVRRNRQHLNIEPNPTSDDTPTIKKTTSHAATLTRDPIITRSRSGTMIKPPDRL